MNLIGINANETAAGQQDTATEVVCNYQDNYYGDQVCMPVSRPTRRPTA